MTVSLQGVCLFCKHRKYRDRPKKHGEAYYICNAFPNGIPGEIVWNHWDHRRPHPNDNGIQFELDNNHDKLPDCVNKQYKDEETQNWYLELAIRLQSGNPADADDEELE